MVLLCHMHAFQLSAGISVASHKWHNYFPINTIYPVKYASGFVERYFVKTISSKLIIMMFLPVLFTVGTLTLHQCLCIIKILGDIVDINRGEDWTNTATAQSHAITSVGNTNTTAIQIISGMTQCPDDCNHEGIHAFNDSTSVVVNIWFYVS